MSKEIIDNDRTEISSVYLYHNIRINSHIFRKLYQHKQFRLYLLIKYEPIQAITFVFLQESYLFCQNIIVIK